MIRFRNPVLTKMQNGNMCIELTEAGTWESFPPFAEALAKQIGGAITQRIDGPDVRLWKVEYLGHPLRLVYDDFPNGISLEPMTDGSDNIIHRLFEKFSSEASKHGL